MQDHPERWGTRLDQLEAEMRRLRDWRHDVASPRLAALEHEHKVTTELLKKTADVVAEMRTEDEFARRLAAELHKRRWSALSSLEKAVLLALAFVPLAALVLSVWGVHS